MKSNRNVKNKLTHFEDCAQAIDQMFQAVLRDQGPGAFNTFLTSARNFNNLSIYNAMLVRVQRPGGDMVGSRKQWRKIGRTVLPDAIPIIILRTFGPVQFLYEQNDTQGRPIPGQDQNPSLPKGRFPKTYMNGPEKRLKILPSRWWKPIIMGANLRALPLDLVYIRNEYLNLDRRRQTNLEFEKGSTY